MSGIISVLVFLTAAAVIAVLTVRYRINPSLAVLGVSIIAALFIVKDFSEAASTVRNGFGYTAGYAGILIIEGMVISVIFEKAGIMKAVAEYIVKRTGRERSALAMSITGYAVAIPVSCDSGFVALSPVNKSISEASGKSLAVISVALSTGLYVTHCLVPPTPGPVTSAGILNADQLTVTLLGIAVSIPAMLAGYFWAVRHVGKHEFVPEFDPENIKNNENEPEAYTGGILYLCIPLLLPVLLMSVKSIAMIPARPLGSGSIAGLIIFAGDPVISLFAGLAAAVLIAGKKYSAAEINDWCTEGIRRAAPVLVVAGVGGAFGAVIKVSSLTTAAVSLMSGWNIGIFLPFLIAAFLKTATGSSTVSMITASSVVAPLTGTLGINPALAVLAVGSGSMMVSHYNDPYFWIVTRFSGMDASSAIRFFTPATAVTGAVSFIFVALLSVFIR